MYPTSKILRESQLGVRGCAGSPHPVTTGALCQGLPVAHPPSVPNPTRTRNCLWTRELINLAVPRGRGDKDSAKCPCPGQSPFLSSGPQHFVFLHSRALHRCLLQARPRLGAGGPRGEPAPTVSAARNVLPLLFRLTKSCPPFQALSSTCSPDKPCLSPSQVIASLLWASTALAPACWWCFYTLSPDRDSVGLISVSLASSHRAWHKLVAQ